MVEHPITPPPELVQQWYAEADNQLCSYFDYIATQAARWGADAELEALLTWLRVRHCDALASDLLAARRPKPPSLAEQATAELDEAVMRGDCITTTDAMPILRAALERLQELEKNG